jgi:heme exporter protein A
MSLFEGRDVTCIRGERTVFSGLAFALDDGQALILRGSNGSGKSSLLRIMAGLLSPASGTLFWEGEAVEPDSHNLRIHYVGHLDGLKPALTVSENLSFWSTLARGQSRPDAVAAALAHFSLANLANIPARMLSAGQRRRLALARLIAAPTSLWLLDEPTTALDAESSDVLQKTVSKHLSEGGLAVIATHGDFAIDNAQTLEMDRVNALDVAELLQ